MPNEIDTLMTLDPLHLSDVDLDKITDYLRASYRNHEASAKHSRTGVASDKPKIDLKAIGLVKEKPPMVRRKV